MKNVARKVIAFVVHDGAVAVCRQHDKHSGLQVPAGTLREGEDSEAGILRKEFQASAGVRPTPLSRRLWLAEREEAPVMARLRMVSLIAIVESST